MELRLVLSFVLAVIAVSVSAQHDHHDHEDHRVNVTVYYESLCSDSRKFFTHQLYPSLNTNLSNYVNLQLVPYGKTTRSVVAGVYNFICHHGPKECDGNKIHACALRLININNQNKIGFNKAAVGFISCLMDKTTTTGSSPFTDARFPTQECAKLNNLNIADKVDECAGHIDASRYLEDYGGMTDSVQNPLKSAPTIVFNNKYKEEDNKLAQSGFVKALCQYIDDKPEECTKNGVTTLKISLGIMLLATILHLF